ncbi:MAG: NAD kinase [Cyclobacteriaceae bacterium]
MKIGVHGKEIKGQQIRFVEQVLRNLGGKKNELYITSRFLKHLKKARLDDLKIKPIDLGSSLKALDFFVSLGGDGTLLQSVTYVGQSEVPILGVNLGRMGFLATISHDDTEMAIDHVLSKEYVIDARAILELQSSAKLFEGLSFALNDFTVMKKDTSSMINVHVFVDGELLNSYWSDGVIVSTPTGSTGYSLSCGGPLLYPKSDCFVITPVSPHNLTARPIVISDSSEISFHVEGRSKKFLVSLDSRIASIDATVNLRLKKAAFKAHLIQMPGHHHFKTLRQKLNWGLDIRN